MSQLIGRKRFLRRVLLLALLISRQARCIPSKSVDLRRPSAKKQSLTVSKLPNEFLMPLKNTSRVLLLGFIMLGVSEFAYSQAVQLAITSINGGSQVQAGVPFTVTAEAQDGGGVPAAVASVTTVTLSLTTGTGTFGGTISGDILAGQSDVTISGCTYTKAESGVVLTASTVSLTPGTSAPFSVTAGPPATIAIVSGSGQSAVTHSTLSPFVILVTDANGNPVDNVGVTFSLDTKPIGTTGQVLSPLTSNTLANGQASTTLSLGTKVGQYVVSASVTGAPGITPVSFTATATAGSAAKLLEISGNGQSGSILSTLAPFVVEVNDVDDNPVSGITVTFGITSVPGGAAGQSLTTLSGVTGSDGRTSSTLTLGNGIGSYVVSASNAGLSGSPQSFSATATVGQATAIAILSGNGQSAAINSAINPFVVKVTDAGGNPVSGVTVNFSITSSPSGAIGSINNASGVTGADGQTSTTLTLGNKVGNYVVDATSGSLTGSPRVFTATATAGSATTIAAVSGSGQTAAINSVLSPFVVKVTDVGGNPVSGVTVNFSITSSPIGATGSINNAFGVTGADGQTSTTLTLGNKVGSYVVSASSGALSGSPLSFSASAIVGSASAIAIVSGNGQNAAINSVLSPFVVKVTDGGGNPVGGVTVAFAITTHPASDSGQALTTTSTVTGPDGQASTTLRLGNKVGGYTVNATSVGLAGSPLSFSATATVGPASAISLVSGNSQTGTINSSLSPFVVKVVDVGGNPDSGVAVNFSIAAVPIGATGQSMSTINPVLTGSDGQASTTLTLGNKAGSYTVDASSGALLGSPVSFAATATPGSAAGISVFAGDNQTSTVGTATGSQLIVLVTDAGANPLPGVQVTFAADSLPLGATGQSFTQPTAVTGPNGHAATGFTVGSKAGLYVVGVRSSSLPGSVARFHIAGTAGPAATLTLVSGNDQMAAVGSALLPFVASVTDADGNPVSGIAVNFSITSVPVGSTGSGLSAVSPTTDVNGQVSSQLTLGTKAGQYLVQATSNGSGTTPIAGSPLTFTANALSGSPGRLVVTRQPSVAQIAGHIIIPGPMVTVEDADGNLVPTDTSTITAKVLGGSGVLSGTLSVAATGGVATFSNLNYSVAEQIRIRFSAPAILPDSTIIMSVGPDTAFALVMSAQPSGTVAAGSVITPTPKVQLRDRFGNVVPSSGVNISVNATAISGGLIGTLTQPTNGSGESSFPDLVFSHVGGERLHFVAAGLTPVSSDSFAVQAGSPDSLVFLSVPAVSIAGLPLSSSPVVEVHDVFGNVVTGNALTITLSLTIPSGAQLRGQTSVTSDIATGRATFGGLSIDKAGQYTFTATAGGVSKTSISQPFTVTSGSPTRLVFTQQPTSVVAGTRIQPSVIVMIQDSLGNPVTVGSAPISLSLLGGGSLQGGVVTHFSASGVAVFDSLTILTSGTGKQLNAVSPGFTGATSTTFQVRPAPAARLAFSSQPVHSIAGVAFSRQPVAAMLDPFGNVVTGTAQAVTIGIGDTATHGASLLGTTKVVAVDTSSGTATFAGLAIDKSGAGYTLTITGSTISTIARAVVSDTFSIASAPANRVIVETEANGSGTVLGRQNISSGTPVTVYAIGRDAFSNYAGNLQASWTLGHSGGVVAADLVAASDGKSAVFTGAKVGRATITASVSGLISVPSDTLTVVNAGAASKILVETAANGTGQVVPAETLMSGRSLKAYAIRRDADGNFIDNAAANWSVSKISGSVADSDLVPSPDGKSATLNGHKIGRVQIVATLSGLQQFPSDTITVVSGTAARLVAVAGSTPQSAIVNHTMGVALAVIVQDSMANPVGGLPVRFLAPLIGPSGAFGGKFDTVMVSNAGGIAIAPPCVANTIAGSYADTALLRGVPAELFQLTNLSDTIRSFLVTTKDSNGVTQKYAQTAFWIRVQALDAYRNLATSFTGSASLTGSGTMSVGSGVTPAFVNGALVDYPVAFTSAGRFVITAQRTGGVEVGTSDTINVLNPVPAVTSIDPPNGLAGQTLDLTIKGTGFINGVTIVAVADPHIATATVVNSFTQLTVTLRMDSNVTVGAKKITVANLPPGGGATVITNGFIVGNNPVPTLISIAPVHGERYATLTVTLAGTNFLAGATTFNSGPGITVNAVTVASDTLLTANITITASASLGSRSVTVVNGPPGGGTSNAVTFGVTQEQTAPPQPLSPSNGTSVQGSSVTLTWSAPTGGAGSYHLQVASDPLFSSLIIDDSSITTASRLVTTLQSFAAYFWHVKTRMINGATSSYGDTWQFNTFPLRFSVSSTITYPQYDSPGSYQPTDYRIVGLPGSSAMPITKFLGGTSGTDWMMYYDNGAAANYLIPYSSGDTLFAFGSGKAFWLIKRGSWLVNDTVASALPDTSGIVRIPLRGGWNLVTNPFPFSITWSQVQHANNDMVNKIFGFDGSGMAASQTFAPYTGYYFENTDSLLSMVVPFGGALLRPVADVRSVPSDSSWSVDISLEKAGVATDRALWFGVAPRASEGRDRFDFHKPHTPGAMPQVVFERPSWDNAASAFASDIRPPVREIAQWNFTVRIPDPKEQALNHEIRVIGTDAIPSSLVAFLVDPGHARSQDLRKNPLYEFPPTGPTTSLEILVGDSLRVIQKIDQLIPRDYALEQNYPNPFNPSTIIPVRIPVTGVVSLVVYNILGEKIRTVHEGPLETGRYLFRWEGNNDRGIIVSSGVYLCRMTVPGNRSFVRKLMFLK